MRDGALRRIGVIGAGAWGTALARVMAMEGRDVKLWARDPNLAAEMRRLGENRRRRYIHGRTASQGLAQPGECPTDGIGHRRTAEIADQRPRRLVIEQTIDGRQGGEQGARVICLHGS